MAPDLQSVLIILLYWQMKSEYLPSMQSHKDMILLITMVPAGLNGYYILSLIILPRLCTPLSSSINTKQHQHTKTNLFFSRITELHYELRGRIIVETIIRHIHQTIGVLIVNAGSVVYYILLYLNYVKHPKVETSRLQCTITIKSMCTACIITCCKTKIEF